MLALKTDKSSAGTSTIETMSSYPTIFFLRAWSQKEFSEYLPHIAGSLDNRYLIAGIFSCLIVSALELFSIAPPIALHECTVSKVST